ncbi:helix-turn-helix domain-containing protein [Ideonella sp.]|jgi:transcriptional regulator with XRE-family HTH domain|uniref:helix-turn-helix domain-containing protein n=1 Tax=Ideonella sp. TaxID=1929293 RepID=UPI0037BFF80B
MPSTAPLTTAPSVALLKQIGEQIHAQRKSLGISATVTAEAAGVSRMTLHRIERGEPSVTAGAWTNVLAALGLGLTATGPELAATTTPPLEDHIPVHIRLADYPQLKALAWQVKTSERLTAAEALDIYERNARHLDASAMSPSERALLNALRTAFGRHFV